MKHMRIPLSTCLSLLLLVLFGACESEPPNLGVTLDDVAEDAQLYYGQVVTVSGEVDAIWTPQIFTIGGGGFGSELLVISADTLTPVANRTLAEPVVENDIVQVTGSVRPFIRTELEEEYGLALDAAAFTDYENEPVLVAQSTAAVANPILVTPRTPLASAGDPVTSLEAIVDAPAGALDRREAALANVTVQEEVGDNMFWISTETGQRLFVVLNEELPGGDPGIDPGEQWTFSGVLRAVPSAPIIRNDWDVAEEVIRALENEAVYLQVLQVEETGL